jgi:two-component system chemotaxis response regulator CheY
MARILVVDDSAIPRMVLRKMLERSGHDVVEAPDGEGALAEYQRERPDLVVLDLVLKNASGLDVLADLRRLDPGARVIMATGETDEATRHRALQSGANAFISKPFAAEQVLGAIEVLVAEPACSVLQLDRLREACMADTEAEHMFLRRLMASAPEMLAQIQAALAAGDGARVLADAHGLKGDCLTLGADALGAACEGMEKAAQQGDLAAARALLAQAERELTRLRRAVEAHLGSSAG